MYRQENRLTKETDIQTQHPNITNSHLSTSQTPYLNMGWLRLVGSLKLLVSFAEYRLFYRALLRPIHKLIIQKSRTHHQPILYISPNHCNTLHNTATHCNTLHNTATHCNTLHNTATHCNTLHNTATHCNTLHNTATQLSSKHRQLTIHPSSTLISPIPHLSTTKLIYISPIHYLSMGWLRLVGSFKLQVSFAKEPYKRDCILQKRPIILRSLLIVATPYHNSFMFDKNRHM